MLYPQSNQKRSTCSLSGIWNFCFVPDDYVPLAPAFGAAPIAVPASINDLFTEKRDANYLGKVLFEREFSLPQEADKTYFLRIGALSHRAEVFLNGEKIGTVPFGFLPVDFPLAGLKNTNRLSIIIDNRLDYHTLPMGRLTDGGTMNAGTATKGGYGVRGEGDLPRYKMTVKHDFYNYTGIHRDVIVYGVPENHIEDVTVQTVVGGDYSKVRVLATGNFAHAEYTVLDGETEVTRSKEAEFTLPKPRLWSHEDPHLYTLVVSTEEDEYRLSFGVRKVSYDQKGLYLNDKPVYLKGFGMHEDAPILGKGNCSALNIKNFELLRWIGANSIRTSHYPYAEEVMDLADRYGILVTDEVPAVGVNHWDPYTFGENRADGQTKALHRSMIERLWSRDKNHPSVVMLSVGNEAATFEPASRAYFEDLIALARSLSSLPVTLPEETKFVEGNYCADLVDFLSLNRYYGWYDETGNLQAIAPLLKDDLTAYYEKFRKPIIVTEFGADTIDGFHSLRKEAFSEEYQAAFLAENCRTFDELPFVVGEHVWNFADFKTGEGIIRVGGNRKGVFTKEREPKAAAFFLKERWKSPVEKKSPREEK